MLWACIRFPQLALDAVLRQRASPDAPLVLVDGPAQAPVLLAVNAPARAAGLAPGMPLAVAEALLGRFEIVRHEPTTGARWQRFLAAWAWRYSSEVALLPQAVAFEASRSLALFGPWPRFEARLREDLRALGFHHRIALAPGALAAHALAGVHDGLALTAPDAQRRALASLKLADAGLPEAAAEGLAAVGVRSLGALLRLPRDGLRRRFGGALLQHLDRLTGAAPDALLRYRPPERCDLRLAWDFDLERSEALTFPLRRLTADLAVFLIARDGGVEHFSLLLEHAGREPTRIEVKLLTPGRDAGLLFDCARGRLERLALPAPVRALRLLARDLPSFTPLARDLFDARPAQAVPLDELRERLRARLGEGAIDRLSCTVDPRPERAQASITESGRAAPAARLPRPTWLLPAPIPLRGPAPELLAGPERIETGWWDGGDLRRDYYLARTAQGQRAWVFCAPGERGPFMLHGWFA